MDGSEAPRGGEGALPGAGEDRTVLVADDSPSARRLLRARLEGLGYAVIEACDGREALAVLEARPVPVLVLDWMMPGMDGPTVCRHLRARSPGGEGAAFTYVILLTSKEEKADVSEGLNAGADDFLSKPVHGLELAARLKAAFRLVSLQRRLTAQRDELASAYGALKAAHDARERDLGQAGALQRAVEPPPFARLNGFALAAAFEPAGHVGGDHVGYFPVGKGGIGAYAIDVSGHGVASALFAMRLAQLFSPHDPDANIAFRRIAGTGHAARDPAEVMAELNADFLGGEAHGLYFTMVLAILDGETGRGRLCRAGHAAPLVLGTCGAVRVLEDGAPPVALLESARYESVPIGLARGERLLLHSDGLTEAPRADGNPLDEAGLARHLAAGAEEPAGRALPALVEAVRRETAGAGFEDDVSALLVERAG